MVAKARKGYSADMPEFDWKLPNQCGDYVFDDKENHPTRFRVSKIFFMDFNVSGPCRFTIDEIGSFFANNATEPTEEKNKPETKPLFVVKVPLSKREGECDSRIVYLDWPGFSIDDGDAGRLQVDAIGRIRDDVTNEIRAEQQVWVTVATDRWKERPATKNDITVRRQYIY
jgi:hypothetical protein